MSNFYPYISILSFWINTVPRTKKKAGIHRLLRFCSLVEKTRLFLITLAKSVNLKIYIEVTLFGANMLGT